ncbi:MAG: hypothetical protein P8K77_01090 [Polaribacter sp.]|nr:hypothetical protein [Polaribacter sp.]
MASQAFLQASLSLPSHFSVHDFLSLLQLAFLASQAFLQAALSLPSHFFVQASLSLLAQHSFLQSALQAVAFLVVSVALYKSPPAIPSTKAMISVLEILSASNSTSARLSLKTTFAEAMPSF